MKNTNAVSWSTILLHTLAILPLVWLLLAIQQDWLGAEPSKDIQQFTGRISIRLLLITLAISPIAQLSHQPSLMRYLKPLGLWLFFWVSIHLLSYFWLEIGLDFPLFFSELLNRFYLCLGIICWLILLMMATTSFKFVQEKWVPQWRTLHNFLYLVAILAPAHALLATKTLSLEFVLYAIIALILLSFRYKKLQQWFKK